MFMLQNDTCITVEADAPFSLPLMNCFYTIKVKTFDVCIYMALTCYFSYLNNNRFILWDLMAVVNR